MKPSHPVIQNLPARARLSRNPSNRSPLRSHNLRKSAGVPIVLALRLMARKPATTFRRIRIAVWNELRFTKSLALRGSPAEGGATMP
jgi:hypothetical protein